MTITVGSNLASLAAQRNLNKASKNLETVFQRLSSGLRLNSASDGAADISVAESLKADATLAGVAIRNLNDGLSLTSIADSTLAEIGSVLQRMSELANQSANGIYTNVQRSAMTQEFSALGSEIARISAATQFNGIEILNSGNSNIVLQAGFDSGQNSLITVQSVSGTLASLGLADATTGTISFSISDSSIDAAQSASRFALDAIDGALTSLNSRRGTIGAAESRLSIAISNLEVSRENFLAAESNIRDADIAKEAAELTRLQILQQAGTSILAQANAQPGLALSLLQ